VQQCLVHSRYIYLKLTYLTFLAKKQFHVTTQTQNFILYHVAMDIVAKEEWTSDCSHRCYFAISFSALFMLILHPIMVGTQQ
jgi:hypothetical protein